MSKSPAKMLADNVPVRLLRYLCVCLQCPSACPQVHSAGGRVGLLRRVPAAANTHAVPHLPGMQQVGRTPGRPSENGLAGRWEGAAWVGVGRDGLHTQAHDRCYRPTPVLPPRGLSSLTSAENGSRGSAEPSPLGTVNAWARVPYDQAHVRPCPPFHRSLSHPPAVRYADRAADRARAMRHALGVRPALLAAARAGRSSTSGGPVSGAYEIIASLPHAGHVV